jgi:hypothetical protein
LHRRSCTIVVRILDEEDVERHESCEQGGPLEVMEVVRELLPVLPTVATQLLPEIVNRLTSRVMARALREIFA